MPIGVDQTENDDEQQIEALDECERLDIDEIFGDDDEQQEEEEIDSYTSMDHVEHVTVEDYSPETIVCDQPEVMHSDKKRKFSENLSQNGSSQPMKLIKIDVQKSKQKNGIEATKTLHGKGKK